MLLRAIQPESNSYVSQIFVIRIWAIKDGGYTGSQFDELQRKITEGVVGKGGTCLMVEEWIAYCVDFLVFQHVCKCFPSTGFTKKQKLTVRSWHREDFSFC